MTNTITVDQLIKQIEQWSIDRNLHTANPMKQYDKLIEEHGELVKGLNKDDKTVIQDSIGDVFVVLTIMMQQIKGDMELAVKLSRFGEGNTDTLNYIQSLSILGRKLKGFMSNRTSGELFSETQVMISNIIYLLKLTAKDNNTDLITCVNLAYNEIKDRKGKKIDGKFVKESDL
ncbi:MazG-like family protein [Staphylococcus saprophyticus]|uniref:MazG-like family protein n=1 Tax=Staphylococcus saprophyticus TaxID=29385 RepID=UPI0010121144|nr:MazG-like family protein [Staphylococcus saprophyticus]MDW3939134.1 MazG-like family protein [Staphylococcus saprophyticus]MDW4041405.1 MazG-like family protein [Staphylococcus saprophyticus]MDW4212566.1 MazG-like family protein [Staphylococcus saprophyticus]MDW4227549.1 MazG-like family protein [Staphylococcus saprophyticus]MDW4281716.1 MazG-like family protein [Staphylococcus saprophyticus]